MNVLTWGMDWICRIYAPTAEDQSHLCMCRRDAASSVATARHDASMAEHAAGKDKAEPEIRLH
jgi:hypothetical protein